MQSINNSGYVGNPSETYSGTTSRISSSVGTTTKDYWSLSKLKRSYLSYLDSKRPEIDEQQESRRYRHGCHWTAEQIKVFNKRRQPVVTYNRIGRKIDEVVGIIEKMRQDPKAYPRTPKHEQGAELATATLRYVLDQQEWKAKSPVVAEMGAVDGIGGIELELSMGDHEDPEVAFEYVDTEGFFYDPRSFRADFSDASYMGIGKWVDSELAKDMFPDKSDEIEASIESGSDLTTQSDRDNRWFSSDGDLKRIRMIDCWYKHKGEWCWCIFTGSIKLMEGQSYFFDEKKKAACKFIMYSAAVDQDGDRYGFVRNLKSANDEINQRRSKGLHELNSRRMMAEDGAFADVEKARVEAAKPDGVVIRTPGLAADFDDAARIANIEGQFKFLEDAKAEIENFGPNPALIGSGVESRSGRAIALLQQAGIAELGPYILAYRGWKVRVYRAIWNAVQRNWTAERWIRITDDDGIAQFVQINAMQVDPATGMPTIVNQLGSLDVDIILDEGPDQVNMMGDAYDTLTALAGQGAGVPPQVLIELSPLAGSVKKRLMDMLEKAQQQPAPELAAKQAEMQMKQQDSQAQLQLKAQDAQNSLAMKQQDSQATLELKAAEGAQQAQLKREEAAANMEIERERAANTMQIEREKAALQMQLARDKAFMDCQIKMQCAEHDASMKESVGASE